jgi:hypothetical protein
LSDIYTYTVEVDYGISVDAAIDEASLDSQYVERNCQIPVAGTGTVTRRVTVRHFDRVITWQQAYDEIGEGTFADPMTALAIALKHPGAQRKFPLAVLWKDGTGGFWSLILHELAGERRLNVLWQAPGGRCVEDCRFLCVVE